MKKHLSLLIIIIFLCASSFLFFGCSGGELNPKDIDYIEFREGSLKAEYSVDEKLDFNNIYIVIVLKDKKGDIVEKVLPSMMEGFDTSTTTGPAETRAMRVKYMGFYTTHWNYIVTNVVDIDTKARINLSQEKNGNNLEITASLAVDELTDIKGLMMDISFDTTKIIRQDIHNNIEGWEISLRSIREGSFSILFYAKPFEQPIDEDKELFVMVFDLIGTGDPNLEVKNIILSDGNKDIYLPNVTLN